MTLNPFPFELAEKITTASNRRISSPVLGGSPWNIRIPAISKLLSIDRIQQLSSNPPRQQNYIRGSNKIEETICIPQVNRYILDIEQVCDSLAPHFNEVSCNLYYSPKGKGTPLHYDSHDVLIYQAQGTKRWEYASRPFIENPSLGYMHGHSLTPDLRRMGYQECNVLDPTDSNLEATKLEHGDLLFIPKGTWHRTSAPINSTSLTFGLY